LRGVEAFARYVYLEAARRGLDEAEEVIVLGDGADWIWNHIADLCDTPVEILDFYHASKHVKMRPRRSMAKIHPRAKRGQSNAARNFWRKAQTRC
jgi:hypothetical protein